MRASIDMDFKSLNAFDNSCELTISKVGNGSRKALVAACNEISEMSLNQVPVDTLTLMSSQFWEVTGNYKEGWEAVIGYGGNGDPVNPKTGRRASSYMVAVHEDLSAVHIHGKAKFLEDPLREYARENFPRTVLKHVQSAF
jgi:hypothetical protein